MLRKENRLSTPFEYRITKKYGQKIEGDNFTLYILKPENYTGQPKIGFVVSTRFSKNATDRNRIKRLFRETVRKNIALIPADRWVSIYPKHSSAGKTYEEIDTDFTKNIQKNA